MKRALSMIAGLVLALTLSLQMAWAQSPPLGPSTFRSDQNQLSVGILALLVKGKVNEIITNANTMIKQQTSLAKAEFKELKVYQPWRRATEYTDRPNQYYVDVPMNIGINIDISYTSDRQIYFPLDLKISCDGWQTGNGKVTIVSEIGPPSVEGGNIIEDIVHVRDYINNLIKHNIGQPGSISIPLPAQCTTIGSKVLDSNDPNFSFIAWDPPGKRLVISSVLSPTLEVKLLRLKRLTARGNGSVLYNPTENILLSTYADFSYQQVNLTMNEGDDVALNTAPVILKPPLFDKFVMIANIEQGPYSQPKDSAFEVSPASANYSPGVHTLQITKTYVMQPNQAHSKPIFVQVPAYELTYSLKYTNPRGSVLSTTATGALQ